MAPEDLSKPDERASAEGKFGYIVAKETFTIEGGEGTTVSLTNVFYEWTPTYDGSDKIDLGLDDKTLGILGAKDIRIVKGEGYSSIAFAENEHIAPNVTEPAHWSVTSGTAKWIQTTDAGFTLNEDGDKFVYSKEKKNEALVTIGGLNRNLKVGTASDKISDTASLASDDVGKLGTVAKVGNNNIFKLADGAIAVDAEDSIVTVKEAALVGTTKVTVSSGYELKIGDGILQYAEEATEWVADRSTASYKTHDKAYYDIDNNGAIIYHAATAGTTHLAVTGLNSVNADLTDSFDSDNHVVSLGADQLNKTIAKLSSTSEEYNGYKLVFGSGLEKNTSVGSSEDAAKLQSSLVLGTWTTVSSGNSTLKGTQTKGYLLADDGLSISYSATDKNVNVATIKGLNKDVKGFDVDEDNKVIALTAASLDAKTVAVTSTYGYKLSLESGLAAPEISDETSWNVSGGNATLKGAVETAGYTLSLDEKTATYTAATAANKTVGLVTVRNINSDAEIDVDTNNKKITLGRENIKATNNVSVTGGLFAVEFADDYDNASVFGSASSDTISIGGSGVSINTANGDDLVDMGNESGNVFFYATGNGNDVIANFDASDKIKLTNSTIAAAAITKEESDVLIKIGTGSIRLDDWGEDADIIHIVDRNNKETIYSWSDDKNAFISELVTNSNAYVLGDLETAQDPVALTKQNAVVYSGKK